METQLLQERQGRERGQILPLTLVLLLSGILLLVPSLNYMATGLKAGQSVETKMIELYSADAGVEDAIWKIKHAGVKPTFVYTLPHKVNNLTVQVAIEGNTLAYGLVLGTPGVHSDWLVVTGSMTYDPTQGNYIYTISVTNQAEPGTPPIKLDKAGVQLPRGFTYLLGSSRGITTLDPVIRGDPNINGQALFWDFRPPHPAVAQGRTLVQTFRLVGEEGGGLDYAWVVAQRTDIGLVPEVEAFRITAKAGKTTIQADVVKIKETDEIIIACWQIF